MTTPTQTSAITAASHPTALTAAAAISQFLVLGMHHSTTEGQAKIAVIIQKHFPLTEEQLATLRQQQLTARVDI